MNKYVLKPAAARYFFKNGCVELSTGGMTFYPYADSSCPNKKTDDIIINRDYIDIDFVEGDFYKFLWKTCSSKNSFAKKAFAIGYMLCNKLPRGGRRCRAFLCVNEAKGAYANGKTLFARAIAQFCNAVFTRAIDNDNMFWLGNVEEKTNLLVIDDMPSYYYFSELFALCTGPWRVLRKAQDPLVIPPAEVPYILVTSPNTAAMFRKDGSFRRRFVLLEFAPIFGPEQPIYEYIGRIMFRDWDEDQWHMFDNFMLDCIMQYLYCSNDGEEDIFSLYE